MVWKDDILLSHMQVTMQQISLSLTEHDAELTYRHIFVISTSPSQNNKNLNFDSFIFNICKPLLYMENLSCILTNLNKLLLIDINLNVSCDGFDT